MGRRFWIPRKMKGFTRLRSNVIGSHTCKKYQENDRRNQFWFHKFRFSVQLPCFIKRMKIRRRVFVVFTVHSCGLEGHQKNTKSPFLVFGSNLIWPHLSLTIIHGGATFFLVHIYGPLIFLNFLLEVLAH